MTKEGFIIYTSDLARYSSAITSLVDSNIIGDNGLITDMECSFGDVLVYSLMDNPPDEAFEEFWKLIFNRASNEEIGEFYDKVTQCYIKDDLI